METKKLENKDFNPLIFLISLGAGGLSIGFWIFLNFGLIQKKGLISMSQIHVFSISFFEKIFYSSLEFFSIIFALIHFITLFYFLKKFLKWKKSKNYKNFIENPIKNSSIMAIFLAIDMSFNIIFAIGNHFIIQNGIWFEKLMIYALFFWMILYLFTIFFSLKILKTLITQNFNINKIHFGFMIHPFALAMIAVTGNGIAAFSKNFIIANIAFFFALIPLIVACFLTILKTIILFSNFFKNNLPKTNLLPSTFILMPTLMLIFLSFLRIGHFFENSHNIIISKSFFILNSTIPFAFLLWYGIFGLFLLKENFKNLDFTNISNWSFICPLVSFIVIGTISNKIFLNVFLPITIFLTIILIFTAIFYFILLFKQFNIIKKI